jgi:hypothetical protein
MFGVLTEEEIAALFAKLGSACSKFDMRTGVLTGDLDREPEFRAVISLWKDCNALRGELNIERASRWGIDRPEASTEFDLTGRYVA